MLIKKSFVENPLDGGVQEREEGLVHHLAIEPEVNSGDGRGFDFVEMREGRIRLLQALGEQLRKGDVRDRENVGIGGFFAVFVEAHASKLPSFEFQAADR